MENDYVTRACGMCPLVEHPNYSFQVIFREDRCSHGELNPSSGLMVLALGVTDYVMQPHVSSSADVIDGFQRLAVVQKRLSFGVVVSAHVEAVANTDFR